MEHLGGRGVVWLPLGSVLPDQGCAESPWRDNFPGKSRLALLAASWNVGRVCVCVCVCERERERERDPLQGTCLDDDDVEEEEEESDSWERHGWSCLAARLFPMHKAAAPSPPSAWQTSRRVCRLDYGHKVSFTRLAGGT